jgi:hypothetical protein
VKLTHLLVPVVVMAMAGTAAADPSPNVEPHGPRWNLTLAGGALAPIGPMRDTFQSYALLAGIRFGVRAPIGIGVQLALDYSPLPRKDDGLTMVDTVYGTAALMPGWTLGHGVLRLSLAGGPGVALERTRTTSPIDTTTEQVAAPAAIGQMGLELHVSKGGGVVLMAGGTKTFQKRDYQYAWAMAGLALEF